MKTNLLWRSLDEWSLENALTEDITEIEKQSICQDIVDLKYEINKLMDGAKYPPNKGTFGQLYTALCFSLMSLIHQNRLIRPILDNDPLYDMLWGEIEHMGKSLGFNSGDEFGLKLREISELKNSEYITEEYKVITAEIKGQILEKKEDKQDV